MLLVLEEHRSALATSEVVRLVSSIITQYFVRGYNGMEWEFHVICGDDTDSPAWSRCGDNAVVWLSRSSAVKFVKLTDGVRTGKDLDLGLYGTLSEVTTPKNQLGGLDIIRNVEITDGTASTFGGSSLNGSFGGCVKDLLRGSPGVLHSVGVGNFGTKLDWEFVASSGRDFQGLGSRLEFEHGTEGGLVTILTLNVDRVDSTNRSNPLVFLEMN